MERRIYLAKIMSELAKLSKEKAENRATFLAQQSINSLDDELLTICMMFGAKIRPVILLRTYKECIKNQDDKSNKFAEAISKITELLAKNI